MHFDYVLSKANGTLMVSFHQQAVGAVIRLMQCFVPPSSQVGPCALWKELRTGAYITL